MRLQSFLLLLILPVVFAVSLVSLGVSSRLSSSAMEAQVQQNARLLSVSFASQIEASIRQYILTAEELSSAAITAINVETALADTQRRHPEFKHFLYTSRSGRTLMTAPYAAHLIDFDFSGHVEWRQAITSKTIQVGKVSNFNGSNGILVFSPALFRYINEAEPQVDGVVVGFLPLDNIFKELKSANLEQSGEFVVIDSQGRLLLHPDSDRVLVERFVQLPAQSDLAPIQMAMVSLKTGFATYQGRESLQFSSFAAIPSPKWSLAILGNYNSVDQPVRNIYLISLAVLFFSTIVLALLLWLVVRRAIYPLEKVSEAIAKIREGHMYFPQFKMDTKELAILTTSVSTMVEKLKHHQTILEQTVIERTRQWEEANDELLAANDELNQSNQLLQKTRDALWSEIELAHHLQRVLLPKVTHIPGYDIAASMRTAKSVGGDYYDVINQDGSNWLIIGDVSGHGVSSGLVMMMVQTAIHTALSQNPTISPIGLLELINKTIHSNIHRLGDQKYMTMSVFSVGPSGEFSFAGAHLPILIWRQAQNRVEKIETKGAWVGLIPDIQGKNDQVNFTLESGDLMLLYTDGLTEALTPDGSLFGEDRLIRLLESNAGLAPLELCERINKACEGLSIDDDLTILAVRKVGPELIGVNARI